MSMFVDQIAELTSHRDREQLDVALAGVLRRLLQPRAVTVLRCVGEGDDRRWLTRAQVSGSDQVITSDKPWVDLDVLPKVVLGEVRLESYQDQCMVLRSESQGHKACFPLYGGDAVVGVVEIETPVELSAGDQDAVQGVLRIYRNFERLLHYSERDSLTGLLNRKTFDESFMKATADLVQPADEATGRRVCGATCGYWIGVVDIDHFKRVNDRYGHLIGDEVLLLMSRLMGRSFRIHDRLYRFGGEEFLVLMRCHGEDDAAQAFERFRANAELFQFPQVGTVTVSIGFTAVRPGDTPSSAFERADKAVYHAKTSGRNQVCSYADLLATGLLEEDSTKTGAVELF